MNIEIVNAEDAELTQLFAAIECALRHPSAELIRVIAAPRIPADAPAYQQPGWLEYGIQFIGGDCNGLYMACIQRTSASEVEICS